VPRALAPLSAFVATLVACTPSASALISPVVAIDGPSAEIVELGGVAMAADGTGGIVYRKRVEGRPHVFAALYSEGKWGAPQRVDVGQPFESSFPAIAAGEGGRLMVVWVNHYSSTSDGLFSAALTPGSSGFQVPVPIDLNIRQATGTYPSVAMNGAGQTLVAYRVITAISGPSTPEIPPGYVKDEIRMARSEGMYWSSFGQPLNRAAFQPVPAPTAANSPKVAIDLTGLGLLVWQEPDDSFVNRVYARRVFGLTPGNVLQVSPSTYEGHPLGGAADEIALDVGGFGQGAVIWRQQPAPGSGFTRPRVFVNEIPSSFDPKGNAFEGARIVDGGGVEGPGGPIGPLSVAVDAQGKFDAGFGVGDQSFDVRGGESSVSAPTRLDEGGSEVPGEPQLTRGDSGALAAAWKVQQHDSGAVAVLERRADGTPDRQLVSAPLSGEVRQLDLAGSHHGDSLIGFLQGAGANTQIAAVAVKAPPTPFVLNAPQAWVSSKRVALQWEPPVGGAQPLSYGLLVDGQEVAEGISKTECTLGPSQIGTGVHTIVVDATDALGQVQESLPATLKVDRSPPAVRLRARGSSLTVRVSDRGSGVRKSSVRVSFGDGAGGRNRTSLNHSYARGGTYVVFVTASDKAGNKTHLRRRMQVS
jgi:hypothetical protein